MAAPLVLRLGRISEELTAEVGTYPYLRMVGGLLMAGGAGNNLQIIGGTIYQIALASLLWDKPSAWDSGVASWGTSWDVVGNGTWDAGAATWT